MSESDDNVIHVRFGPDGGRVAVVEPEEPPPARLAPARTPDRVHDPLADLYTTGEVSRLFQLTPSRLRYWDTSGFLAPSGRVGRRRVYTFQDLIGVRVAKSLLDGGLPLQKVRKAVEALRGSLPKVTRPLAELRVVADGHSVVVRDNESMYEPTTGQLSLDFQVSALEDDVVRVLRPKVTNEAARKQAYDFYLEGCRYDEDEATFDRAEEAYRKAISLDRSLANALTNLGNLRFRRGDAREARRLYEEALAVDPTQPEAFYNLGFLLYEEGETERASVYFTQALDQDPAFADAHFNLAMALEELGRTEEARQHWESYLELDPSGPWAEVARRHLGDEDDDEDDDADPGTDVDTDNA
ncbi:MAG: tetratricopeptide repeat protein [Polyangiales bacterium]